MDLGLSDRVYVVTEAADGVGRACAQSLAAEGARLVLCAREESSLAATAAALGGGERAIAVSGDLSEPGFETCLAAAAVARYGRLDGALIAVGDHAPSHGGLSTAVTADRGVTDTGADGGLSGITQLDDECWRSAIETAFLGPLRLARAISRTLSNEGGSVLFVLASSAREAELEPVGGGSGAVSGLAPGLAMTAKSLADELGPRNVRVNVLIPGQVESDGLRRPAADAVDPEHVRAQEERRRRTEERVPLRRFGEPLEFARPAVFLLSPAASYVTGSALVVDGGLTRSL